MKWGRALKITVSAMLAANLLGLLGLAGFAAAIGGLTGNWWWAALIGSIELVAVAVVLTLNTREPSVAVVDSPHELARVRSA
jgi:hypothetical protein